MSALTEATIIVEAGETSDTLHQARAAFHQGRKLFILESCFQVPGLAWPYRFEELGAIQVRELDDIRKSLGTPEPGSMSSLRSQHFFLSGDDVCFFLGEHTPRAGYARGETNNFISNLKKKMDRRNRPKWHYKEEAIGRAAAMLAESLNPA